MYPVLNMIHFTYIHLVIGLTFGKELSLSNRAVRTDVYVVKPLKITTPKERALMLRLKKPSSSKPFDRAPSDRMDPVEWLDSLLQGVYHPLDDKGQVVEDVPETRGGFQSEDRPSNKKRLNLKKTNGLERQFVYRPLDMGQLRLETPVRLERPLPVPAAFRNQDKFRNARPPRLRNQQPAFNDDFNAPLNHRPSFSQSNQQGYSNQQFDGQRPFNSLGNRPNHQQQTFNNQRPNYQVQIYHQDVQPDNYPQDNYQQEDYQQNQQDDYQQQNYNQQSDFEANDFTQQQDNFNQQQDQQQPDYGNQDNRPEDPYLSQQEPYQPPVNNNNYSNGSNQQSRPPGRKYVVNVDVYVNQNRNKRNHLSRSKNERNQFRHSYRPVK